MARRGTKYEGESGSNGYCRGKEQWSGLRLEQGDNALWKLCTVEHDGEHVEFSMEVLQSFHSSMARQRSMKG